MRHEEQGPGRRSPSVISISDDENEAPVKIEPELDEYAEDRRKSLVSVNLRSAIVGASSAHNGL